MRPHCDQGQGQRAEGLTCAEGFDGIHFTQMNVVGGILGSREESPTRELQCCDVLGARGDRSVGVEEHREANLGSRQSSASRAVRVTGDVMVVWPPGGGDFAPQGTSGNARGRFRLSQPGLGTLLASSGRGQGCV